MRTISNSDRIKFCLALGLISTVDEDGTLLFHGVPLGDDPTDYVQAVESIDPTDLSGYWETSCEAIPSEVIVTDFGDWRASLIDGTNPDNHDESESAPEPDACMRYKTIGEWNSLGYVLIHGQTHHWIDEHGTPIYTDDQVVAGDVQAEQTIPTNTTTIPDSNEASPYDTFEGWKSRGFVIIRGEKSRVRDTKNTPLFHMDQVRQVVIHDDFHDGLKYQTFEEWSVEGYLINRGAKSMKRNPDGVPLFSEEQVSFAEPDDGTFPHY